MGSWLADRDAVSFRVSGCARWRKYVFKFRHYAPTLPPTVTCGITERMKDIEKVLAQLEGVARKWRGLGREDEEYCRARDFRPFVAGRTHMRRSAFARI